MSAHFATAECRRDTLANQRHYVVPPSPHRLLIPPLLLPGGFIRWRCRRGGTGVWPIPEPFWVDRNLDVLPPRPEAQPELVFRKPEPGSTDAASSAEVNFFSLDSLVSLSHLGQIIYRYIIHR